MLTTFNLPCAKQQIGPVIGLSIMSILAFFFHDQLVGFAQYDRSKLLDGEVWRALTAHLFHTNLAHLALNIAGFALLWALHGDSYTSRRIVIVYVVCALGVSVGIYVYSPQLSYYVGLSGVLHGLFVWGACDDIKQGRLSGYGLLIGLAIKIGAEQLEGPSASLGQWISATVAIDAHLFGALSGFAAYAITRKLDDKKGA